MRMSNADLVGSLNILLRLHKYSRCRMHRRISMIVHCVPVPGRLSSVIRLPTSISLLSLKSDLPNSVQALEGEFLAFLCLSLLVGRSASLCIPYLSLVLSKSLGLSKSCDLQPSPLQKVRFLCRKSGVDFGCLNSCMKVTFVLNLLLK